MSARIWPATRPRELLAEAGMPVMPCSVDPLSARLTGQTGFRLGFMSGFAASAVRPGLPDTGPMSDVEVLDQGRNVCSAVDIPVIGDGDTGHGKALNLRRTVHGFAQAGSAGVMFDDQLGAKLGGHTRNDDTLEPQRPGYCRPAPMTATD